MILTDFPKNCMKLRKFWTVGGACAGSGPHRSATGFNFRSNLTGDNILLLEILSYHVVKPLINVN